ncbi:trigger factor [Clostridium chauvoei]|uniref:Trigger factor n=2 Tax=Clostridium chauvoei TaxID=46867 RepID=S6FNU7_9CLOT|nr:trigger factor [Clostridium chauvoei]ATD55666.1 trigger factor [Clostridium chauvoei]ATD56657.1 trigger factor [Clostridium chauvoei]MBX7280094.1 trigger factor [Clostridium chauvoei]MBX7282578.1 trigger factor [Clostridium chauvoei]MBX7284985.1 trigger factor [Clostridium chauvoei]
MEAKMEKIDTNVVKFEVTVEAKEFQKALTKAYNKNVKKFNVPGFRKGKVPMAIVKQYYGVGALMEDAINFAIEASYPQTLSENNIIPVDYPKVDILTAEEGKDFVYTAEVTVYPEVQLGEYKGLKVEKPSYSISDEEINAKLKEMQEKNARIESKEDAAIEKGNLAVIDFKGFVDGEAFQGGEGADYTLEIGSGTFIDNFEDQLVGAKIGDKVEVNVTFPENYGKEELNGKPAKFEVTVKDIKIKELPALDDEFAKEVSEFDTLAEVKEDITKKLEEANKAREEREYEEAIINAVVENAKVEVPEVMVNKEIDSMVKSLEQRLQYQGLTLDQYFQFTGTDADKMRDYMKENAAKKVKTDLVLEAVEKAENIEVTEEELKAKAEEVAKMYSAGDEKMINLLLENQKEALTTDVKAGKTIKLLVESNK